MNGVKKQLDWEWKNCEAYHTTRRYIASWLYRVLSEFADFIQQSETIYRLEHDILHLQT